MTKVAKKFTIARPGQFIHFDIETPQNADKAVSVSVVPTVKQGAAKLTYWGMGAAGLTATGIQVLGSEDRAKATHEARFTGTMQRIYYASPLAFGGVQSVLDGAGDNVTAGFVKRTETFTLADGSTEPYEVLEGIYDTTLADFPFKFFFA